MEARPPTCSESTAASNSGPPCWPSLGGAIQCSHHHPASVPYIRVTLPADPEDNLKALNIVLPYLMWLESRHLSVWF